MERPDRLGALLDQSRDKIALLDEGGTITYVNRAAERILGFEPSELVGDDAFSYVHPDDVDDVREAFYETVRDDAFVETTAAYRHRTADGSWVWLESRLSNQTGEFLDGFVVSSRDVTGRVEAERRRERLETRLEQLAAVTSDVLWLFDADWSEVLFVNEAYEAVYGQSVERLRANPTSFLETVHPDDVAAVEEAMARLSDGHTVDVEYRVGPDVGYSRWVWVQAEPIVEDGDVVRIAGFTKDITDRRRREQQLFVMDTLLRHTLRNDLNVIIGTAELLEEEFPEAAERTGVIRQTGESLLRTAEKERELVALVNEHLSSVDMDLRTVLEEGAETVRERYPEARVEVGNLESVTVRGRPELRRAVVELLENAIQHSRADRPHVRLSLRVSESHARVVVEDEAPPIPAIEARVLDGDHDMNDVYHSSGLGLWLVYWSVELSDGEITVETGDEGNCITVSLPRADAP